MHTNWWENFFHGVALDFWRAAISDEQTLAEADFTEKQLRLPANATILDVPCGNGRLSIELARRGFTLTGVDIAAEFIAEAQQKTMQSIDNIDWQTIDWHNIEWHERDMRNRPWTNEFNGAFCFGNSFGYLDDNENTEFLQAVSRSLKSGARFILDAPAIAECILPNFQASRAIELAGIAVSIEHRYDHEQGRMFNDFTFTRDGVEDKRPSSQRIYTYRELTELLRAAGLEVVSAYASLAEDGRDRARPTKALIGQRTPKEVCRTSCYCIPPAPRCNLRA
jgi:SAM-dependent methyltransferase